MKVLLVILLMSILTGQVNAAQPIPNVLQVDELTPSPVAGLEVVSWIAGHWRGEAFGGTVEEVWSTPLGNSMMGAFKLVVKDTVQFYELETIMSVDDTLVFRLKHFSGDLTSWEEKDEFIDFRLVKVTENNVFFNGLTLERINENTMNIYVAIEESGKITEHKFHYKRVRSQ